MSFMPLYKSRIFLILLLCFSSIQFIQFHQIHFKSNRSIGYRSSPSKLYWTLVHKASFLKVTFIIQATNKMALIYGYLIDWFHWYDWLIHFHSCVGYRLRHKNIHIILYCILYMIKEDNMASNGDNSRLLHIKILDSTIYINSKTLQYWNISACVQ